MSLHQRSSGKWRIVLGMIRKRQGYIELSKGNMMFDLIRLMKDGVIKLEDLDEFSDELKENIKLLKERFY